RAFHPESERVLREFCESSAAREFKTQTYEEGEHVQHPEHRPVASDGIAENVNLLAGLCRGAHCGGIRIRCCWTISRGNSRFEHTSDFVPLLPAHGSVRSPLEAHPYEQSLCTPLVTDPGRRNGGIWWGQREPLEGLRTRWHQ